MSESEMERFLSGNRLFEGLGPSHLKKILEGAHEQSFAIGQSIFVTGGAADHFYVIRKGRVLLEVSAPGRGHHAVQSLGPGDVLGWSWLVPPYRWHFDAHVTAETVAVMLDGRRLREAIAADHSLGYTLLSRFLPIVVERLQMTRFQLLDVYGNANT